MPKGHKLNLSQSTTYTVSIYFEFFFLCKYLYKCYDITTDFLCQTTYIVLRLSIAVFQTGISLELFRCLLKGAPNTVSAKLRILHRKWSHSRAVYVLLNTRNGFFQSLPTYGFQDNSNVLNLYPVAHTHIYISYVNCTCRITWLWTPPTP